LANPQRQGNGTKFTIDRKIFSSDIWYSSPWKLKIWIYLLGHANYKDNEYMGIKIKRGQLLRGYRRIAQDCGYKIGYRLKKPSLHTIRRICEELTKEGRIERRTTQGGTLFTICNYEALQPFKKDEGNAEREGLGNGGGTEGEQDKKELRKNKERSTSTAIDFDFSKRGFINILPEDIAGWKEAYPACQIETELKRMVEWILSNPTKRKKNYRRFITNWLARTQEKGGGFIGKKTFVQRELERIKKEKENAQNDV